MRTGFVAVTLIFLLTLIVAAPAQEKRIKKSQLPPAVQKAVQDHSEGATVRGYSTEVDNGKREYEVQLKVNGHNKDVTMDGNGKVLEVEEQVDLSSLPAEVRDGLKDKAGKGNITQVESLTKEGKLVAYEAQVRKGTKRSEVQVGPDGKTLATPQ